MARVRWTLDAIDHLNYYSERIATGSPRHANAWVRRVKTATRRLARFPNSGRLVPEFDDPLVRELIVGDYRVVYELEGNTASVVAVRHGSMILRMPVRP